METFFTLSSLSSEPTNMLDMRAVLWLEQYLKVSMYILVCGKGRHVNGLVVTYLELWVSTIITCILSGV